MNRNPTEARTEEETKGYPAEDTEPYEARYKTKYKMEQRRQYDTRPEEKLTSWEVTKGTPTGKEVIGGFGTGV